MAVLAISLRASMPVMFGYVPLGMAFGLLFQDLGYDWYYATLMGLIVFAGAAQFMAIGLLLAHAGLVEIAVSTFILNARHLFFGLSVMHRYRASGLKKLYLVFGLTDETYSLVTSTPAPEGVAASDYYLAITALNHLYWVVGCSLGALAGASLQLDTTGMDFALTALFLVLVIEQWKQVRDPLPFAIAAGCSLLAIALFEQQMLLVAIALSIGLLLLRYRREQRHA